MIHIKMRTFRTELSEIIARIRFTKTPVALMRFGEPVAVVISTEEYAEYARLRQAYAKAHQLELRNVA